MIDWSIDQDWDAISHSPEHPQHHIVIDRYDVHICRECSTTRLYVLRKDEVQRLLLVDRPSTKSPTG